MKEVLSTVALLSLISLQAVAQTSSQPVGFDSQGRPVVTGKNVNIIAHKGQVIGLLPSYDHPNKPVSFVDLQANGILQPSKIVGNSIPELFFTTPDEDSSYSHLSELALSNGNEQVELTRAVIRVDPSVNLVPLQFTIIGPDASFKQDLKQGEQVLLFNGTSLACDVKYGQVIRANVLSPGTYNFHEAKIDASGTVELLGDASLVIPNRFSISASSDGGTIVLDTETSPIGLNVKYQGNQPLKQVRIFLNGVLKKTVDASSFEGNICMPEVPSGNVSIGVAGVLPDGNIFPIEHHDITIKNNYYEQLAAKNADIAAKQKELQDLLKSLPDLDGKVAYWLQKAQGDSQDIIEDSTTTGGSMNYFGFWGYEDWYMNYTSKLEPGPVGDDLAHANEWMNKRAGVEIQIGVDEGQIGMVDEAIAMLGQVVTQMGKESPIGGEAEALQRHFQKLLDPKK